MFTRQRYVAGDLTGQPRAGEENVSICSDTSLALCLSLSPSLSLLPSSLLSHLPCSGKDNSHHRAFFLSFHSLSFLSSMPLTAAGHRYSLIADKTYNVD